MREAQVLPTLVPGTGLPAPLGEMRGAGPGPGLGAGTKVLVPPLPPIHVDVGAPP